MKSGTVASFYDKTMRQQCHPLELIDVHLCSKDSRKAWHGTIRIQSAFGNKVFWNVSEEMQVSFALKLK